MKKLFCLVVVLLLVMTAFVACGETETTTETPTTTTKVETTTTEPETTTTEPETTTTEPTPEPELPTIDDASIKLNDAMYVSNIAIETHHDQHGNNPCVALCFWNNDTIYHDIIGTAPASDKDLWSNTAYKWVLSLNGKYFEPKGMSVYHVDDEGENADYGFFRCDLGPMSDYDYQNKKFTYSITIYIVNVETGKVTYYAELGDIVHNTGMIEATNKPEGITAVEGVTCVGGPDMGGDEGADKAFDGDIKTKLCTFDEGADNAIIANLGGAKTLKGISLVNANDNEGSNRTVISFEVWTSTDGETWGEAAAWVTTGEGINKDDVSTNFAENFYSFGDTAVTGSYVKLVINNGDLFQFSEVIFYQ